MRSRGVNLSADVPPLPAAASSDVRKRRPGRRGGVFRPSCLCPSAGSRDSGSDSDDHQLSDQRRKEHDHKNSSANQVNSASVQKKSTKKAKAKAKQTVEPICTSSTTEIADLTGGVPRLGGSCAKSSSTQPMSRSSRFFSRFIPRNLNFKFSRAAFGSSDASTVPTPRFTLSKEEDFQAQCGFIYRSKSTEFQEFLASYVANKQSTPLHENFVKGDSERNPTTSGVADNLQGDGIIPIQSNARVRTDYSTGARCSNKKVAAMEPVEENVCLNKTANVGGRDRVLLGSATDFSVSPLQQERELKDVSQGVGMQPFGSGTRASDSYPPLMSASSPTSDSTGFCGSIYRSENYDLETARSREARYRELLEHKSNSIERRRRERSQVRGHQRSRSRSDNHFEHERSCNHRAGRCSCPNGDTGSRAGVSRIVVLAEALFEVLDEIHQQSVDLPSQPSVTSTGSVPARNETLKSYLGSQKPMTKEIAQCCLCLVEYERNNSMKVLPCRHEFHRTCIDKWLKENQRSCPLCRSDACRQDSVLRRK